MAWEKTVGLKRKIGYTRHDFLTGTVCFGGQCLTVTGAQGAQAQLKKGFYGR
jgi:hypothetical protein